jgi:hypothetical protein
LIICFMISISGPCRGANNGLTRTRPIRSSRGRASTRSCSAPNVPARNRSNSSSYSPAIGLPCNTTTWLRLLPRCAELPGVFVPVSVRVKFADPVSTAAESVPGSRTTNF